MKRTLAEAFAYFDGAKAANPRWGWAAQSDDGRTVVLTMWKDQMSLDGDHLVYRAIARAGKDEWVKRPGNKDRLRKLQHAIDNCGGLFRAVIVEAVDTKANVRATRNTYLAHNRLTMKVESLNSETGEFWARSVEPLDDPVIKAALK